MAFTIRKEAFEEGVKSIKICPYYNYGVCIRIYEDDSYELWNIDTIPISAVVKAVDKVLIEEKIQQLVVKGKIFKVPQENKVRELLFDFLTALEKEQIKEG